jgi:hypothetical protein
VEFARARVFFPVRAELPEAHRGEAEHRNGTREQVRPF